MIAFVNSANAELPYCYTLKDQNYQVENAAGLAKKFNQLAKHRGVKYFTGKNKMTAKGIEKLIVGYCKGNPYGTADDIVEIVFGGTIRVVGDAEKK